MAKAATIPRWQDEHAGMPDGSAMKHAQEEIDRLRAALAPGTVQISIAALDWVVGEDTGASSMRLWSQMTGAKNHEYGDWPHDPADFGRCLRLLERVPAWQSRLPEMAVCGAGWEALLPRWNEVADCMAREVGHHWEKGRSAPQTKALMRSILEPASRSGS